MAHRGKQSMRKFKRALKGTYIDKWRKKEGYPKAPRMTKADWRDVAESLGRDAGPGVRKKAGMNPSKRKKRARVSAALKKYLASLKNPAKTKGRKVKGGRAVTLRNFTGTVVKKSDGTVQIVGKGRKK